MTLSVNRAGNNIFIKPYEQYELKTYAQNNADNPFFSTQTQVDTFQRSTQDYQKTETHNTSSLREELEQQKRDQGIISKAWDGIKNFFGAKNSSSNVEETIKKFENGEISEEEARKVLDEYKNAQSTFTDKLSGIISTAGLIGTVAGAVLSFIPGGQVIGLPLLAISGKVALGGMFVDNALDLVDNSTDKDGLTSDELKDLAIETGVEAVSYMAGRGIGKLTGNMHTNITNKLASKGTSKIASQVIGYASEAVMDGTLSLGADYGITQAQSLITTGKTVTWNDYWSWDRFTSEGRSQLIGILTGVATSKQYPTAAITPAAAGTEIASKVVKTDTLINKAHSVEVQTNTPRRFMLNPETEKLVGFLRNIEALSGDKVVWYPKNGSDVSLSSVANYLSLKINGNPKNGFVMIADDTFIGSYLSNPRFKAEVDKHITEYPETELFDFRSNTSNAIEIGGKNLMPIDTSANQQKTKLLNEDFSLSKDTLEKINKTIDDTIASEETRILLKNFLKQNITIDTYESEIAIMHKLKEQIAAKGIEVTDSNTYFYVPREWGTVPKSGDRISYMFATEMGIDGRRLITDVSKIPAGANIVCLDDFAGSGNSLISFAAALSKCNAKSATIAPLTTTRGLNEYWTTSNKFNLNKLLEDWSVSDDKQNYIISRMQSDEKLTLMEIFALETDPAKKKTLKEILSKADPDEKSLDSLEGMPLHFISGRSVANVYTNNYFNSLTPVQQNKLLNALGLSSVASILGYGNAATTYSGPIMATNTNVGIMYKICKAFGIRAKDAEARVGSMKLKASDFDGFTDMTEKSGAFIFEGDLINGTKNHLEVNGYKYTQISKFESRTYQMEGRTFVAEYDGKTANLYETTNGEHTFIQEISPNRDAIPKIQVEGKKKPISLTSTNNNYTILSYGNGEQKIIITFSGNTIHIYNPENEFETYQTREISSSRDKRRIWQIN